MAACMMIVTIIGAIALTCDGLLMYGSYKKENLVGVIFWGLLFLAVTISLHA